MTEEPYPYASPPAAQVWQPKLDFARPPDPPPLPLTLAVILATVVGVLAAGNATMAPVASSLGPSAGIGFIVGVGYFMSVLGSIGAQAVLMTILLVFAQEPLWRRLAWHWGLALLSLASWCFGFAVAEARWVLSASSFPREELVVLVTGLPLVSLACQAPMWLFRLYFGWQIERQSEAQPIGQERLSIRDFLVGTILVALTMAAVRLGKPMNVSNSWYWGAWGIGTAAAAGISLLCAVPILYLTLGVRNTRWGAAGIAAIVASVAATAISTLVWINRINPGGGLNDKEITLMISALVFGFTATLAGALSISRAYGYRLVTERPLTSPFGAARSEPSVP